MLEAQIAWKDRITHGRWGFNELINDLQHYHPGNKEKEIVIL